MGCIPSKQFADKSTSTECERESSIKSAKSRYVITINTEHLPTVINGYGSQTVEFIGAKSISPRSPDGGVFTVL